MNKNMVIGIGALVVLAGIFFLGDFGKEPETGQPGPDTIRGDSNNDVLGGISDVERAWLFDNTEREWKTFDPARETIMLPHVMNDPLLGPCPTHSSPMIFGFSDDVLAGDPSSDMVPTEIVALNLRSSGGDNSLLAPDSLRVDSFFDVFVDIDVPPPADAPEEGFRYTRPFVVDFTCQLDTYETQSLDVPVTWSLLGPNGTVVRDMDNQPLGGRFGATINVYEPGDEPDNLPEPFDLTCVNPGTPEEDCWNLIVFP
jgi:hypothetical protein